MSNDEHKLLCGVEWGAEWRPLPRSHLDPSQAQAGPVTERIADTVGVFKTSRLARTTQRGFATVGQEKG